MTDHEYTNKSDHCTISLKGVSRMREDDETEFVPLDRWEQEHKYFQKLIKVRKFPEAKKMFDNDRKLCRLALSLGLHCVSKHHQCIEQFQVA